MRSLAAWLAALANKYGAPVLAFLDGEFSESNLSIVLLRRRLVLRNLTLKCDELERKILRRLRVPLTVKSFVLSELTIELGLDLTIRLHINGVLLTIQMMQRVFEVDDFIDGPALKQFVKDVCNKDASFRSALRALVLLRLARGWEQDQGEGHAAPIDPNPRRVTSGGAFWEPLVRFAVTRAKVELENLVVRFEDLPLTKETEKDIAFGCAVGCRIPRLILRPFDSLMQTPGLDDAANAAFFAPGGMVRVGAHIMGLELYLDTDGVAASAAKPAAPILAGSKHDLAMYSTCTFLRPADVLCPIRVGGIDEGFKIYFIALVNDWNFRMTETQFYRGIRALMRINTVEMEKSSAFAAAYNARSLKNSWASPLQLLRYRKRFRKILTASSGGSSAVGARSSNATVGSARQNDQAGNGLDSTRESRTRSRTRSRHPQWDSSGPDAEPVLHGEGGGLVRSSSSHDALVHGKSRKAVAFQEEAAAARNRKEDESKRSAVSVAAAADGSSRTGEQASSMSTPLQHRRSRSLLSEVVNQTQSEQPRSLTPKRSQHLRKSSTASETIMASYTQRQNQVISHLSPRWKYALTCVITDVTERRQRLRSSFFAQRRERKELYIAAYSAFHIELKKGTESAVLASEMELELEEVLFFRSIAEQRFLRKACSLPDARDADLLYPFPKPGSSEFQAQDAELALRHAFSECRNEIKETYETWEVGSVNEQLQLTCPVRSSCDLRLRVAFPRFHFDMLEGSELEKPRIAFLIEDGRVDVNVGLITKSILVDLEVGALTATTPDGRRMICPRVQKSESHSLSGRTPHPLPNWYTSYLSSRARKNAGLVNAQKDPLLWLEFRNDQGLSAAPQMLHMLLNPIDVYTTAQDIKFIFVYFVEHLVDTNKSAYTSKSYAKTLHRALRSMEKDLLGARGCGFLWSQFARNVFLDIRMLTPRVHWGRAPFLTEYFDALYTVDAGEPLPRGIRPSRHGVLCFEISGDFQLLSKDPSRFSSPSSADTGNDDPQGGSVWQSDPAYADQTSDALQQAEYLEMSTYVQEHRMAASIFAESSSYVLDDEATPDHVELLDIRMHGVRAVGFVRFGLGNVVQYPLLQEMGMNVQVRQTQLGYSLRNMTEVAIHMSRAKVLQPVAGTADLVACFGEFIPVFEWVGTVVEAGPLPSYAGFPDRFGRLPAPFFALRRVLLRNFMLQDVRITIEGLEASLYHAGGTLSIFSTERDNHHSGGDADDGSEQSELGISLQGMQMRLGIYSTLSQRLELHVDRMAAFTGSSDLPWAMRRLFDPFDISVELLLALCGDVTTATIVRVDMDALRSELSIFTVFELLRFIRRLLLGVGKSPGAGGEAAAREAANEQQRNSEKIKVLRSVGIEQLLAQKWRHSQRSDFVASATISEYGSTRYLVASDSLDAYDTDGEGNQTPDQRKAQLALERYHVVSKDADFRTLSPDQFVPSEFLFSFVPLKAEHRLDADVGTDGGDDTDDKNADVSTTLERKGQRRLKQEGESDDYILIQSMLSRDAYLSCGDELYRHLEQRSRPDVQEEFNYHEHAQAQLESNEPFEGSSVCMQDLPVYSGSESMQPYMWRTWGCSRLAFALQHYSGLFLAVRDQPQGNGTRMRRVAILSSRPAYFSLTNILTQSNAFVAMNLLKNFAPLDRDPGLQAETGKGVDLCEDAGVPTSSGTAGPAPVSLSIQRQQQQQQQQLQDMSRGLDNPPRTISQLIDYVKLVHAPRSVRESFYDTVASLAVTIVDLACPGLSVCWVTNNSKMRRSTSGYINLLIPHEQGEPLHTEPPEASNSRDGRLGALRRTSGQNNSRRGIRDNSLEGVIMTAVVEPLSLDLRGFSAKLLNHADAEESLTIRLGTKAVVSWNDFAGGRASGPVLQLSCDLAFQTNSAEPGFGFVRIPRISITVKRPFIEWLVRFRALTLAKDWAAMGENQKSGGKTNPKNSHDLDHATTEGPSMFTLTNLTETSVEFGIMHIRPEFELACKRKLEEMRVHMKREQEKKRRNACYQMHETDIEPDLFLIQQVDPQQQLAHLAQIEPYDSKLHTSIVSSGEQYAFDIYRYIREIENRALLEMFENLYAFQESIKKRSSSGGRGGGGSSGGGSGGGDGARKAGKKEAELEFEAVSKTDENIQMRLQDFLYRHSRRLELRVGNFDEVYTVSFGQRGTCLLELTKPDNTTLMHGNGGAKVLGGTADLTGSQSDAFVDDKTKVDMNKRIASMASSGSGRTLWRDSALAQPPQPPQQQQQQQLQQTQSKVSRALLYHVRIDHLGAVHISLRPPQLLRNRTSCGMLRVRNLRSSSQEGSSASLFLNKSVVKKGADGREMILSTKLLPEQAELGYGLDHELDRISVKPTSLEYGYSGALKVSDIPLNTREILQCEPIWGVRRVHPTGSTVSLGRSLRPDVEGQSRSEDARTHALALSPRAPVPSTTSGDHPSDAARNVSRLRADLKDKCFCIGLARVPYRGTIISASSRLGSSSAYSSSHVNQHGDTGSSEAKVMPLTDPNPSQTMTNSGMRVGADGVELPTSIGASIYDVVLVSPMHLRNELNFPLHIFFLRQFAEYTRLTRAQATSLKGAVGVSLVAHAGADVHELLPETEYRMLIRDVSGEFTYALRFSYAKVQACRAGRTSGGRAGKQARQDYLFDKDLRITTGFINVRGAYDSWGTLRVEFSAAYRVHNTMQDCVIRVSNRPSPMEALPSTRALEGSSSLMEVSHGAPMFWSASHFFLGTDQWSRLEVRLASMAKRGKTDVEISIKSGNLSGATHVLTFVVVMSKTKSKMGSFKDIYVYPKYRIQNSTLASVELVEELDTHALLGSGSEKNSKPARWKLGARKTGGGRGTQTKQEQQVAGSAAAGDSVFLKEGETQTMHGRSGHIHRLRIKLAGYEWSGPLEPATMGSHALFLRLAEHGRRLEGVSILRNAKAKAEMIGVDINELGLRVEIQIHNRPRYGPPFRVENLTGGAIYLFQEKYEEWGISAEIEQNAWEYFSWNDVTSSSVRRLGVVAKDEYDTNPGSASIQYVPLELYGRSKAKSNSAAEGSTTSIRGENNWMFEIDPEGLLRHVKVLVSEHESGSFHLLSFVKHGTISGAGRHESTSTDSASSSSAPKISKRLTSFERTVKRKIFGRKQTSMDPEVGMMFGDDFESTRYSPSSTASCGSKASTLVEGRDSKEREKFGRDSSTERDLNAPEHDIRPSEKFAGAPSPFSTALVPDDVEEPLALHAFGDAVVPVRFDGRSRTIHLSSRPSTLGRVSSLRTTAAGAQSGRETTKKGGDGTLASQNSMQFQESNLSASHGVGATKKSRSGGGGSGGYMDRSLDSSGITPRGRGKSSRGASEGDNMPSSLTGRRSLTTRKSQVGTINWILETFAVTADVLDFDLYQFILTLAVDDVSFGLMTASEPVLHVAIRTSMIQLFQSARRSVIEASVMDLSIMNLVREDSANEHVLRKNRKRRSSLREPLLFFRVLSRMPYTSSNPSALNFIDDLLASLHPIELRVSTVFIDRLFKFAMRSVQKGELGAASGSGGSGGATASAAATNNDGEEVDGDGWYLDAAMANEDVMDLIHKPQGLMYFSRFVVQDLAISVTVVNNGFYSGERDIQLPAALWYALRFLPNIQDADLKFRSFKFDDEKYYPAQLARELEAHFTTEGIAAAKLIVGHVVPFGRWQAAQDKSGAVARTTVAEATVADVLSGDDDPAISQVLPSQQLTRITSMKRAGLAPGPTSRSKK
ncbi:hypothetical protein FVE85_3386 [Porphyridium purpureum]|uniref:Uncharacterized protein n=1 Tax=Porphyridium purpureum TaxID=35688 RepID=A0A5J4YV59_PORPP|nr:hypothetical protein FVE85_3386 [Porphyridium purpureum]|eukprot:POR6595..scf227_4